MESDMRRIHYYSYAELLPKDSFFSGKELDEVFLTVRFGLIDKPSKVLIKDASYRFSDTITMGMRDDDVLELVYCKKIYPFGRLMLRVIEEKDRVTVQVNRLYYYLFRLRVENVIPPGIHLRDWTYVRLIEGGFLSLHAATIAPEPGNACVLLAPPNVGKSLTAFRAVKEGWYILSEDISIMDGDAVAYAVPYTSTLFHERSKLKYLGPLSYYVPLRERSIGELFKERILPRSKVRFLVFLEPSRSREVLTLDKDSQRDLILERLCVINSIEFPYTSNPLLNARFYLTSTLNSLKALERRLQEAVIERIEAAFLIRSPSPLDFLLLIKEAIGA